MKKNTSLYLHIPFCFKKCFYCSFVVFVNRGHHAERYVDCLVKEMQRYRGSEISSVYIGGGTPCLLSNSLLEKIFLKIKETFVLPDKFEFTIEANPETIADFKIKILKDFCVNRLSIGVQSLDDKFLDFLGRNHDRACALEAVSTARKGGFENISLDFMYGFPSQTSLQLEQDIREIASLAPEHISLYSLNIEPKSLFHVKKVLLSCAERQADDYLRVLRLMESLGYDQYEISNFSRPGYESEHNTHYWRAGNYFGLGVGAHSHVDGRRSWNVAHLAEYFRRIEGGESPEESHEVLSDEQRFLEAFLFGLRMNEGVRLKNLQASYGVKLDEQRAKRLDLFLKEDFLRMKDGRIFCSPKGKLVLDEISAQLI